MLKKIIFSFIFSLTFISFGLNAFETDDSYDTSTTATEDPLPLIDEASETPPEGEGSWLPELATLFPTMLANPRIIGYSVGYRSYDRTFKTACLPVSIGDQFTIYQFHAFGHSRIYLGIETTVYPVFQAKLKALSLLNADYYIGIPITYLNNRLSVRLRIAHESSHLGDELLLENKHIKRFNPSKEMVDLFVGYDVTKDLTFFGGIGRVIRSNDQYKVKPMYYVAAMNYHMNCFKIKLGNLEANPYIGYYCNVSQDNNWKVDNTLTIGYQCDKSYGHKIRLYLEGRDGFSNDGQFSRQHVRYASIKLLYGY